MVSRGKKGHGHHPRHRYLANKNTKEIHDLRNRKPSCRIGQIKHNHKKRLPNLKHVLMYIRRYRYNGCHWCLNKYDTG